MKLTLYRGSRQIGGSCLGLREGSSRLVLDLGLPLDAGVTQQEVIKAASSPTAAQLVETGLLPDLEGVYAWDAKAPACDGVLISHGHLDHCGLVPFLHDRVPVFMSDGVKEIMQRASMVLGSGSITLERAQSLRPEAPVRFGSMVVTPWLMDHSAFGSLALHVRGRRSQVIYSGDFRAHGRKSEIFKRFLASAPRHVDALIMEGTLLGREREEIPTEQLLESELSDLLSRSRAVTLGWCASQNIDRLVTLYKAARRAGRILAVDIYTAHMLDAAGRSSGVPVPGRFSDLKVFFPQRLSTRIADQAGKEYLYRFASAKITMGEIAANSARVMVLVRPSLKPQIERMGNLEGGLFIYSLWNGYLEDPGTRRFMDWVAKRGMEVHHMHTSGHAAPSALKEMVAALEPRTVVPVHTTAPEEFSRMFPQTRLVGDGETIEL